MECLSPKYLHKQDITVPCGNCAFCGATKRSDWSLRLHYEAKRSVAKRFITLTYANPHLKWKNGNPQLVKSDLQKWFKRVRKTHKFRYFAVGEYGSQTFRPHYHFIIFNASVNDYNLLNEKWGKGNIYVGSVTIRSIMYVCKYHVNKGKYPVGVAPPFVLMSRRPGLGANYLTPAMVEWHRSDRKNYAVLDGQKRHLPRYYKTKIFSKIDLVRIAVRDQKEHFNKLVRWIRSPSIRKIRDPLAYRRQQQLAKAKKIRQHSKENLKI